MFADTTPLSTPEQSIERAIETIRDDISYAESQIKAARQRIAEYEKHIEQRSTERAQYETALKNLHLCAAIDTYGVPVEATNVHRFFGEAQR